MSKVTANICETKERARDRGRRVLEASRSERSEDALMAYEVTLIQRLRALDLIGAESVFFFDTWAL